MGKKVIYNCDRSRKEMLVNRACLSQILAKNKDTQKG